MNRIMDKTYRVKRHERHVCDDCKRCQLDGYKFDDLYKRQDKLYVFIGDGYECYQLVEVEEEHG